MLWFSSSCVDVWMLRSSQTEIFGQLENVGLHLSRRSGRWHGPFFSELQTLRSTWTVVWKGVGCSALLSDIRLFLRFRERIWDRKIFFWHFGLCEDSLILEFWCGLSVWGLYKLVLSLKLSVIARWFNTVQGKEADTPQQMSIISMEATIILPILKKKLAFLSGKNTDSKIWVSSHLVVVVWWVPSLMVCLQGGRIAAVVSSWPSLSAQIRPAWRSSALPWTTCSAFPGETWCVNHSFTNHSDVIQHKHVKNQFLFSLPPLKPPSVTHSIKS